MSTEKDIPAPPEGFTYYGVGPLKVQAKLGHEDDVASLYKEWTVGSVGDSPIHYALRTGSEIARLNGLCGHPHAKLAQQYWAEAETDPEAWRNWELRPADGVWRGCAYQPWFTPGVEYRRRPEPPRTIDINGIEVPEPLREEPKHGTWFWLADAMNTNIVTYEWEGLPSEIRWLRLGLLHATKEAAEIHAKALLSFTETKV